jgi:hypothetical protein
MLPSRTSCIIPYRTSYDLVTIERKMLEPRLIESVPTPLHFWLFHALSPICSYASYASQVTSGARCATRIRW